jgi:hypothetical protein
MSYDETIIIRTSEMSDHPALARLAALDSAIPIKGRALVAEVDGSMRAAVPLRGGPAVADPFAETAHVVELLEAHARALGAASDVRRPRRGRVRGRLIPATT